MSKPPLNLKLIVAYDGTNYLGFQKTKMGPSIEETLQAVLEQILQHPVTLQAASRTDAGVHARGQVVNCYTDRTDIPLHKLWISLNCLLPKDITVLEIVEAPPTFHPTLDNIGKEYVYKVCYAPVQMPEDRLYEWHYHYPLDTTLMQKAAKILCGNHDFSAFKNSRKQQNEQVNIRKVDKITIEEPTKYHLKFTVEGTNFLYKMVRNLVGTLVYVGAGKIDLNDLQGILHSKDRTLAGITAPAHGLTLNKVFY